MISRPAHIDTVYADDGLFMHRLKWALRIAISGCFIGHGMWGLVCKPGWLPFFHVFGIGDDVAVSLMPLIGALDIVVGIAVLFTANRYLILWTIFWTVFTALLRPLAGMGFAEFLERGGNYGPPVAMLLFIGMEQASRLSGYDAGKHIRRIEQVLRFSLFLLLAGHGGIAIAQQAVLVKNLDFISFPVDQSSLLLFGAFEIALGLVVLFFPRLKGLMWFVLFFKLFIESIYPFRGTAYDIFETIERMGDYIIPLALIHIYNTYSRSFSS